MSILLSKSSDSFIGFGLPVISGMANFTSGSEGSWDRRKGK